MSECKRYGKNKKKIKNNKKHSPDWTVEGEGGKNTPKEAGELGTGRRCCSLTNLTDRPVGRVTFIGKRFVNKSVTVPAAGPYGWTS